MKIFITALLISLVANFTYASEQNNQFDWELYQATLDDKDIRSAAQCESIDLTLHGKPLFDYYVDSFAILLVVYNKQKMPIEMELAYLNLRSYHLGRIEGILGLIDSKKKSNELLEKSVKELGCHKNYSARR